MILFGGLATCVKKNSYAENGFENLEQLDNFSCG